jgi:hypothetical protein
LVGKHVLMVLAHCDDELVCGWPILQNPDIKKSLIIISSDRHNPVRNWCGHRKFVTQDLCKLLGINLTVLDYNSEFYKLDHRSGKLAGLEKDILKAVNKVPFDYLFTHNPHGEYGHLDHIFVFNLLNRANCSPLLISDITMESDWTSISPTSKGFKAAFHRNQVSSVDLDKSFYRKTMRFYETRGVWTWSQDPCSKANLYII